MVKIAINIVSTNYSFKRLFFAKYSKGYLTLDKILGLIDDKQCKKSAIATYFI